MSEVTIEHAKKRGGISPIIVKEREGRPGVKSLQIGKLGLERIVVRVSSEGVITTTRTNLFGDRRLATANKIQVKEGGFLEIESPCALDRFLEKATLGLFDEGAIVVRRQGTNYHDGSRINKWPR